MRILSVALAALVLTAAAAPSFAATMAANTMMMSGTHSMMLKPGESIVVMPNGDTMMMPAMKGPMDPGMMKAAMPMDKCMIMMMGTDHMMHMMPNMKMANGQMACMAMMKMAH